METSSKNDSLSELTRLGILISKGSFEDGFYGIKIIFYSENGYLQDTYRTISFSGKFEFSRK